MLEKPESGEPIKNFSEDEVRKVRGLADKVWEVIGWDLTKMCGTSEEVDMVNRAQNAMKEVAEMFDMSSGPHWEQQELKPIIPKRFSSTDIQKLHTNLGAIEEVLDWYIGASDEEEIGMIQDARESLNELKRIL
jgi:hypothetical protein